MFLLELNKYSPIFQFNELSRLTRSLIGEVTTNIFLVVYIFKKMVVILNEF